MNTVLKINVIILTENEASPMTLIEYAEVVTLVYLKFSEQQLVLSIWDKRVGYSGWYFDTNAVIINLIEILWFSSLLEHNHSSLRRWSDR